MHYQSPHVITSKTWNNALSYDARIQLHWQAQITLPSIQQIDDIQDVQLWSQIVLEEIDHNGTLHSCMGLAHIYHYAVGTTPIYIMDNHNHALYFWTKYMLSQKNVADLTLRHIDQHSDLNSPRTLIDTLQRHDLDYIWRYTNFECQISNFIKPFVRLYPDIDFTWIKSESQLLNSEVVDLESWIFILDIDLDFRAPEMSIAKYDETISITRQLIASADLVTIASSPMFVGQHRALEILQDILG